jgi:hypothetical protein
MPHRRKAFTATDLLIALIVCFILAAIAWTLLPLLSDRNNYPRARSVCASNLSQIYKSLYQYGNEHGTFPMVSFPEGARLVGEDAMPNHIAGGTGNPFVDLEKVAERSVSLNLWLLIKNDFTSPDVFLCPDSPNYPRNGDEYASGWQLQPDTAVSIDFPWPDADRTLDYSFIQPWSIDTRGKETHSSAEMWSVDADPRVVLGADANNGPDITRHGGRSLPYETWKADLNSRNHSNEGQNVLYGDSHVSFEKSPFVGIDGDNIYTARPADFIGKPGSITGEKNVRPSFAQFSPATTTTSATPRKITSSSWDTVLIPTNNAALADWNRTP